MGIRGGRAMLDENVCPRHEGVCLANEGVRRAD